ncbi:hypothetical protein [Zavarzinella formosa]|uniref:hypothetical protein n=1 Tax=Zavarzinella formosa TaxID=360055 RepID=UPI001EE68F14|nr:hypothetical protein [Zavarzinella formosa]
MKFAISNHTPKSAQDILSVHGGNFVRDQMGFVFGDERFQRRISKSGLFKFFGPDDAHLHTFGLVGQFPQLVFGSLLVSASRRHDSDNSSRVPKLRVPCRRLGDDARGTVFSCRHRNDLGLPLRSLFDPCERPAVFVENFKAGRHWTGRLLLEDGCHELLSHSIEDRDTMPNKRGLSHQRINILIIVFVLFPNLGKIFAST